MSASIPSGISSKFCIILNSFDFKKQQKLWKGGFGDSYIKRNSSLDQVNELYKKQTGVTQEEIFEEFFNPLKRDISIIELGCNIGLKLSILKKMGFVNIGSAG